MSHINSDAPLHSDAPLEKKMKKVGAHRNAFILGALRKVFTESERYVMSRIKVALTGVKVNIMIFQKTIPNHLICLIYFFLLEFRTNSQEFLKGKPCSLTVSVD